MFIGCNWQKSVNLHTNRKWTAIYTKKKRHKITQKRRTQNWKQNIQKKTYNENVEKYGTVRQATVDHIIRRMRLAYWITKATDTLRKYDS
jgi:hypothetical protein